MNGGFRRNEQVFLTPKPVELLKRIVRLSTEDEDIILDSFAGSGTTAHAVLELNKEDGGNRKFILVQQPFDTKENEEEKFNICEKSLPSASGASAKVTATKRSPAKRRKWRAWAASSPTCAWARSSWANIGIWETSCRAYEQVARYIYFTETSQNFDAAKMDKATGKIGEWKGTSYYLLYSPDKKEDRALDVEFLKNLKDKNLRKVIYCEKVWVHREDLSKFGDVRPMLVPFNLK